MFLARHKFASTLQAGKLFLSQIGLERLKKMPSFVVAKRPGVSSDFRPPRSMEAPICLYGRLGLVMARIFHVCSNRRHSKRIFRSTSWAITSFSVITPLCSTHWHFYTLKGSIFHHGDNQTHAMDLDYSTSIWSYSNYHNLFLCLNSEQYLRIYHLIRYERSFDGQFVWKGTK